MYLFYDMEQNADIFQRLWRLNFSICDTLNRIMDNRDFLGDFT